jgi:hypothetical protein
MRKITALFLLMLFSTELCAAHTSLSVSCREGRESLEEQSVRRYHGGICTDLNTPAQIFLHIYFVEIHAVVLCRAVVVTRAPSPLHAQRAPPCA